MWTHIDSWRQAATELNVVALGPSTIELDGGVRILVDMHFPQYGPKNGMLVLQSYEAIRSHRERLLKAGYGYSVFSPPAQGHSYSSADLAEMLADWHWNGSAQETRSGG